MAKKPQKTAKSQETPSRKLRLGSIEDPWFKKLQKNLRKQNPDEDYDRIGGASGEDGEAD